MGKGDVAQCRLLFVNPLLFVVSLIEARKKGGTSAAEASSSKAKVLG
jgi:hypothetical protein